MEQWKKDTSELDIDDIVKEFSGAAPDDESFEQEFGDKTGFLPPSPLLSQKNDQRALHPLDSGK